MTTYDFGSDLHADFVTTLRDQGRTAANEPLRPEPLRPEPLRSIEKKLIGFSLGIGLFLLAVLAVVNHFFPSAA